MQFRKAKVESQIILKDVYSTDMNLFFLFFHNNITGRVVFSIVENLPICPR